MFSENRRLRFLLVLIVAQIGCLAVGLWIHYRLVISAVYQATEEEASAVLVSDADELLAAIGRLERPGEAGEAAYLKAVQQVLQRQQRLTEVGWVLVDPQWRILSIPADPQADSPTPEAAGETLAWTRRSEETHGDVGRIRGTLILGGERHVAVASGLKGEAGYLVVHRPLQEAEVPLGTFVDSLPASGVIAWIWTSALLIVVVYLIVTRVYDELSKNRLQVEADALRRIQSLVRTRDAVIFALARLGESRDEVTGRHVERVSFYASRLATAASHLPKFRETITPEFVRLIAISSVLHDIGKVGIEDSILFKPGRLTDAERARMQQHATIGGGHLGDIEQRLGCSNVIRMAREIAEHHHERWDGAGYPSGLAGEEIPLAARIVGIADVYEALTSIRDYKPPYPHQRCVEMIRSKAGKHFDPDLVAAFLKVEGSFRRIACQYGEQVFRNADPNTLEPESSEDLQCAGLVSAMKVLDQDWTVPMPSSHLR